MLDGKAWNYHQKIIENLFMKNNYKFLNTLHTLTR